MDAGGRGDAGERGDVGSRGQEDSRRSPPAVPRTRRSTPDAKHRRGPGMRREEGDHFFLGMDGVKVDGRGRAEMHRVDRSRPASLVRCCWTRQSSVESERGARGIEIEDGGAGRMRGEGMKRAASAR